ncbi:NHLP bacteriocin export ABC transporter permease/ATPase subunit [Desulfitobacterium sp.]|uniref:NHLP bacteriocin export ABC transporter permease/ATPase subunit n=1 Tax=Desulfitobacterium sp. TaxID=49981 RepID=UPI002B1F6C6E|nr:NHLP bacteriocin export ABC transporter permease/ATPase subunit [Desulfitobacterium sp.]MEA4902042.1 NHLP bacteriocin export ABC transporter permease/ATPase subunit [Desulfitobacterium sp.]
MSIQDFFHQKGILFPIKGNKPRILDDDNYVWMVEQGEISVFLTTLTPDCKPGVKTFLFTVREGDLLFGMTPEGSKEKSCLLTSGLVGSTLIRLEVSLLSTLFSGETAEEMTNRVQDWFSACEQLSHEKYTYPKEIAATEEELGEKLGQEYSYTTDARVRKNYHSQVLYSALALWEEQEREVGKRLQEKASSDHRLMTNSIYRLASINQKKNENHLQEESGHALLDACRLVGQSMNIEIVPPPLNRDDSSSDLHLEDIARASRIRTREVVLQGEWYKQDEGPILGYKEDDNQPIALIPASPSKYFYHDTSLGIKKVVDKETAAQIKGFGFVFYRPFAPKIIRLRDLVTFGFQNCWKRDLSTIVLMGIFGGLLGTATPIATGIVFNTIIPEGAKGQLLQIALILSTSVLAAMLFQFTRSLAVLRMEGKMDSSLQSAVWDRLISLPVPFFKQFSAGELAMRAMSISQIRLILSGTTLNAILSSLFSVFTFALLFYYDSRLAFIATLLVLAAIIVMGYLGYRQVSYERKILEISNNISGMMFQFIGGVTKFRVAGAEIRAFHRWAKEFGEQRKLSFKKETLGNVLVTFNSFFPILSNLVIFYTLTSTQGALSPGQFIAFNSAFVTFMLSMVSLSESLISANIVIPLYQKAKPILETLPEYDETKINPKPLTGSIEVSHVSFRYNEDGPLILKDISLQINEGDYAAIVGTSGCGKSTLFRVLLGFEKTEMGKVYYNGQDLSKVDIRMVRKQIGVVLQNGKLMTGNIFSNITGSNPFLTIDDAWEAARMAGIEEDIKEMPMGMHTIITEGSGSISGGQMQRLMIARAIINKPKIIYFDEATSALDNRTQAIVSDSLDRLQATRVVIAHRLSTIMNCNKIFVMDQGRIVESGTYQELMDRQGLFTELAKRQLA